MRSMVEGARPGATVDYQPHGVGNLPKGAAASAPSTACGGPPPP